MRSWFFDEYSKFAGFSPAAVTGAQLELLLIPYILRLGDAIQADAALDAIQAHARIVQHPVHVVIGAFAGKP